MRCPYCGFSDTKVTDSRDTDDGIRRRRECLSCGQRFTTNERLAIGSLLVAKKDGRREEFSRDKLLVGLRRACEKRPLAAGAVEAVADAIETTLRQASAPEVPSREIGEMVMDHLRELDHIAYIRFASVYREFADLEELQQELEALAARGIPPGPEAGQPSLIPDDELKDLTRGVRSLPIRRRRRSSQGKRKADASGEISQRKQGNGS
ncbi:MAG: transcriptional repressor NrdR [Chloroflexi bacterium]|nr:transcriptional repressor NrdR [Chloroflexota bacterium]MCI0890375.1 transcriptional repressor NrdR [Chloroflexota bacterium]